MFQRVVRLSLLAGLLLAAFVVQAQSYPLRPVRLVVPFPPGGSLDVVARPLAQKMSELMGQQVIVDNRTGASGNIGSELVARSAPDGYTALINTLPLVVNPSMFAKMPFDVSRDLAPVSLVAAAPFVLVVHPSVPAKSVKELVALAKARPGKLNYASAGNGTNLHIAAELFKNLTGTDIVHVPYKGGGPALTAVLSGESDLSFLAVIAASPYIKAGRMRGLAVTSTKRSTVLPDLPTIAESGVKGYEFASWFAILVPAGTPNNVISTLNGYITKALRSRELKERLGREGTDIIASTPQQLGTHLQAELARWDKVVKQVGIRAE